MNKKQNDENSGRYSFNRLIIIVVFIAFAGTAFYLDFQKPESSLGLDNITNTNIDSIWKKYHEKGLPNSTSVSSGKTDDACYSYKYLNQVEAFNQIKISILEGHKFFGPLSRIKAQAKDNKISTITEKLEERLENNDVYTLETVQYKFKEMRKEISRAMYISQSQHSLLLRSLAKIITIEKRGQSAIDNGGVTAHLEIAYRYLKAGAIKEAYNEINDNMPTEYLQIAQPWLSLTNTYLVTTDMVNELGHHIYSKDYMAKFYKECR